jgi:hypothetical protein
VRPAPACATALMSRLAIVTCCWGVCTCLGWLTIAIFGSSINEVEAELTALVKLERQHIRVYTPERGAGRQIAMGSEIRKRPARSLQDLNVLFIGTQVHVSQVGRLALRWAGVRRGILSHSKLLLLLVRNSGKQSSALLVVFLRTAASPEVPYGAHYCVDADSGNRMLAIARVE